MTALAPAWDLRRPFTLRRHLPPAAADVDAAVRLLLDREDWDVGGDREEAVRLLVVAVCEGLEGHERAPMPSATRVADAYARADRDERIAEMRETLTVPQIAERCGLSQRQVQRILGWRRP